MSQLMQLVKNTSPLAEKQINQVHASTSSPQINPPSCVAAEFI
jgi:hypothetical protein